MPSKATEVRLSQLPGLAVRDVAGSRFHIHPFMLSRWRKLAREGRIVTKGIDVIRQWQPSSRRCASVKKDYERPSSNTTF